MCLAADIEPFEVIIDYIAELERNGSLPVEMIPSMGNPAPQPTVLPALVPDHTLPPDLTLSPRQSPAWTIETLSLPSTATSPTPEPPTLEEDRLVHHLLPERGPTAADEDASMADKDNGGALAPEEQIKVKREESEVEDSGVSSSSDENVPTGSKRRTRSSFEEMEIIKRLRVDEAPADGIDLGEYKFDEDSAVDPELVPLVKGAVCRECADRRVDGCKVTWHLNIVARKMTFRCTFCKEHRRGCSFRDSRWGISTLPTLLRTTRGGVHKKEYNTGSRPTPARKNPRRVTIPTGSKCAKSMESTTSFVRSSESSQEARKTSSKRTAVKKTDTPYLIPDPEGPAGHREVVFFENLDPYTEVLHRADLDSSTLRVAIAGVRVAMFREKGSLAVVRSLVEDRVVPMKRLLDRLELKMEESLRAETEVEGARAEEWENGGKEVNDRGEGPSTSRVRSGMGNK